MIVFEAPSVIFERLMPSPRMRMPPPEMGPCEAVVSVEG
jgi:hypothetical protein